MRCSTTSPANHHDDGARADECDCEESHNPTPYNAAPRRSARSAPIQLASMPHSGGSSRTRDTSTAVSPVHRTHATAPVKVVRDGAFFRNATPPTRTTRANKPRTTRPARIIRQPVPVKHPDQMMSDHHRMKQWRHAPQNIPTKAWTQAPPRHLSPPQNAKARLPQRLPPPPTEETPQPPETTLAFACSMYPGVPSFAKKAHAVGMGLCPGHSQTAVQFTPRADAAAAPGRRSPPA